MNLRKLTVAIPALALAGLAACGTAPGKCAADADCATGTCDTSSGFCVATCGNSVCAADQMCSNGVCIASGCASACTAGQMCEKDPSDGGYGCVQVDCAVACVHGQSCEHLDGGYECVQTDCFPACDSTYQHCVTQPGPPACVPFTCPPGSCTANEECDPADGGGYGCVTLTAGTIVVTQPVANAVTGVTTPLAVSARAGAPNGGPTQVELAVEQSATDAGASIEIPTGNGNGVYAGNVSLADAGFKTGAANVVGTVFYMLDGGVTSVDSPAVQIQIDVDPPAFGAPVNDKSFYSGTASPAQTANVTLAINDVGPANVNPSSVVLTAGAHQYPAISTAYPDGGNGNYFFAVTASDLSSSTGFLNAVPYTVSATDTVGNAATFDGGSIFIDNASPSFDAPVYDAGWYGGDAGISISVNVQDQASGSGLDGGSVALVLGNGTTLTSSGFSGTDTYTFTTTGSTLRQSGQGPVLFNFTAADNAGNVALVDGGQILVDEQAPVVGATTIGGGTAHATGSGWFAQDGGTIQVTTIINDGAGSGPASATLTAGASAPITSSSGTVVDTGTSYSFTVPTSTQTAGSETPIALAVAGTDAVGNTGAATAAIDDGGNAVTLKIDGKPPQIAPPAFVTLADGTAANGVHWFSQVGDTIDFTATITDNGSLVNPTSVALQTLAGASVGVPGTAAGNVYTFAVPRSSSTAGLIAAGAQGLVSLQIVAKDNVGNTATLALTPFGIDGQKPTVSFSSMLIAGKLTATTAPAYPTTGADCAADVDFCGHDAAGHFWRKGETTATPANRLTFYGNDGTNGSSIPATIGSAACSIATSADCTNLEYVATDGNATASFDTVPDFSNAPFATAADGTGTINVTVTVKDLVGNSNSTTVAVNVTRVKWIRKMGGGLASLAGSAIITGTPSAQIIFGGTNTNGSAIASLGPDGALHWRAGKNLTIVGNMAYSPATNLLYVVPNGGGPSAFAYAVGENSAGDAISCTGSGLSGTPALISSGGKEYVMIPDDSGSFHRLTAFLVAGTSCSGSDSMKGAGWAGKVYTATTDGSVVYVGHDNNALGKASFSAGSFDSEVDAAAFSSKITSNVAIAGKLFFADTNLSAEDYLSYDPITLLPVAGFTPAKGASNSTVTQSPIIAAGHLFGFFDSTDGRLHAYSPTTGASQFAYPSTGTLTGISPVSLGADNEIYFSSVTSANAKQFSALSATMASATLDWAFSGTTAGTPIPIASVTTEPTLDSSGTAYFGDAAGTVFALITDSGGPLPPTAGTNWPRVGFDNCNSGNTSLGCQ